MWCSHIMYGGGIWDPPTRMAYKVTLNTRTGCLLLCSVISPMRGISALVSPLRYVLMILMNGIFKLFYCLDYLNFNDWFFFFFLHRTRSANNMGLINLCPKLVHYAIFYNLHSLFLWVPNTLSFTYIPSSN